MLKTACRLAVFVAGLAALSAPARAQLTGTLSGVLTVNENRALFRGTNCNALPAGLLANHCAGVHPVRRVRVTLAIPGAAPITTITNAGGFYSINWTSPFEPAFATLQVHWRRPVLAAGAQTAGTPPDAYRIVSGLGTAPIVTNIAVTLNGGPRVHNVLFAGSEVTAAQAVADDVYTRVVNQSTVLTGDMNGTFIHVNLLSLPGGGIGAFGGVTPDDSNVHLLANTTRTAPWVTAHEIGHLIAWRELGVTIAPMLRGPGAPGSYFACDGNFLPSWTTFSDECEQAAHWEGFANFVEAAWAWTRTAPAPFIARNDTAGTVSMENAFSCATTATPHRRAQCHARALWDIYDQVNDGADTINGRSFISIGSHLRGYPDNCLAISGDDRCSNEGATAVFPDFDAINHWDWMQNWPFADAGTVTAIFFQNGLGGGDPF